MMLAIRHPLGAIHGAALLACAFIAARLGSVVLLAVTVAVAVIAWLGFTALAAPFVGTGSSSVAGMGVNVSNVEQMRGMPLRYTKRIAGIPGATDVTWNNFIPVPCNAAGDTATLNGFGGPGTPEQMQGFNVSAAEMKAWNADPLGALVGRILAKTCGWTPGMTVTPKTPDGQPVEIHIVGRFQSSLPFVDQIAVVHFNYWLYTKSCG